MDIEAYQQAKKQHWDRLGILTKRKRLNGAEIDEMVQLYQGGAADLAQVSSGPSDPDLIARLSHMVGKSRTKIAGAKQFSAANVTRFFAQDLPVAMYSIRWLILGVGIFALVLATVQALWLWNNPAAMAQLGDQDALRTYANVHFVRYYSENPASDFMAMVWTNNARIAVLSVATGISGIVPAYLLIANSLALGTAGAVVAKYNSLGVFFAYITPHGLLELTAVFVAVASGLGLFWALINPGPRSRVEALAKAGRTLGMTVVGLVIMLGVAGMIEAFVTPANLPQGVKITIGTLAFLAWLTWMLYFGSKAWRAGHGGDLQMHEAGYTQPQAA